MSIHYHTLAGVDLRIVPCGLVAIKDGHGPHPWNFDETQRYWCEGVTTVKVVLFKASGKYYTEEWWRVPTEVPRESGGGNRETLGPYDMEHSPDFRRIDNGAVLVESQEPWGYPHLFPSPALGHIFAGHKPGCR